MRSFLLLPGLLSVLCGHSQDLNYSHFDTRDGLASNTIYFMTTDQKGYLWLGTDNGVSRFDGKTFTNYTTDNGLTDNEVLNLGADGDGRIWIFPFNNTICYLKNGKIYNHTNDSLLARLAAMKFSSFSAYLGCDADGTVYFINKDGVFATDRNNTIHTQIDLKQLAKDFHCNVNDLRIIRVRDQPKKKFAVWSSNYVWIDDGNGMKVNNRFLSPQPNEMGYLARAENGRIEIVYPVAPPFEKFNTISTFTDKTKAVFSTPSGAWEVNQQGTVLPIHYLPGLNVTHAVEDAEHNRWFSTLGKGLYRLTSGTMRSFFPGNEAFTLEPLQHSVAAGFFSGQLAVLDNHQVIEQYSPNNSQTLPNPGRLFTIKHWGGDTLLLGFDSHLEIKTGNKSRRVEIRPIKSIDRVSGDTAVICTNSYIIRLNVANGLPIDTLLDRRGTKIIYDNKRYFIGTLQGLLMKDSTGRMLPVIAPANQLKNRIVDIVLAPGSGIWIATNDQGVVQYHDGKIVRIIDHAAGLSSNGCRSLFLDSNYLWVGTNKGLNKLDLSTGNVLARYSTSDGLLSDNINAVCINDGYIWVASTGGVTFFREQDVNETSMCNLDFQAVRVSGKDILATANPVLRYRDNNISFQFNAISFKSAGQITYRYRLSGLEKDWKETNLTTIAYPSLPPGNYTFELFAVNKYGKNSQPFSYSFTIKTPFWKTIGFWLALSLGTIFLISWLIARRYRTLQQRTRERSELNNKIAELEQASLRAQMNPHFIFNCLNSIQHFVIKNDFENTNRYIAHFGNLIRLTLDNAARPAVTIADEIKYLVNYMELEKMRFPESFNYTIETDASVALDYTCIPSMVLQPFVENAIRHGIRHRNDHSGLIRVQVQQENGGLLLSVEDNGVGREAAARFKSQQHIEYQSRGIQLTMDRLSLLGENLAEKVITTITDLKDEKGLPSGTRVSIYFPATILNKLG